MVEPVADFSSLEMIADEGVPDFENYYECEYDNYDENHHTLYYGRNVIWIGFEGEVYRADINYTIPVDGNIFYSDKLASVVDAVSGYACEDRPQFFMPRGYITHIDVDDVEESNQAFLEDRLHELNIGRPYTTGDEELDLFIAKKDDYLTDDLGFDVGTKEFKLAKKEFAKSVKQAIKSNSGDLGQYLVQIRDGNHRAFGAFLAGEKYVYIRIDDATDQKLIKKLKREGLVE